MRTLHLGPEELLVAAKIAVRHDDTAAEVAAAIDAAEARIRDAVPIARVIYLEPDIYSEARAAKGPDPEATPGGPASPVGPLTRPPAPDRARRDHRGVAPSRIARHRLDRPTAIGDPVRDWGRTRPGVAWDGARRRC